jgi:omega-6 fatty acid desaturase (delta-12 desaturase)
MLLTTSPAKFLITTRKCSYRTPDLIDLATPSWEASAALKKRLATSGLFLEGRPGGWAEVYRVFRECKFVEDEGNIVFYKNAMGLAASRPLISADTASDSGIELEK